MWINVFNSLGVAIGNASVNFPAYNNGNGWYWVQVGDYQNVCVSAPGYYTLCANDGTVPNNSSLYMWYRLAAIPSQSPPPGGNCWS
jgi:hypothetical protein